VKQLVRDGVTLFYDEEGDGDPPVLLVHGWCCDHTYFAPQFEHFRRDHRTVAVDLRGHGRSDKPEQDYTMAAFADDLAWLCGEIGLQKPVVVGHSMGGVVALDLAARYPDLPAAIVALDSPIVVPEALKGAVQPLIAALRTDQCVQAAQGFVANMFHPSDDAARKARIIEAMCAAPQHVMASAMEQIFQYDSETAAKSCTVPVLAIGATSPPSDFARFRTLCSGLVTGQTVGTGHFHQLEVPGQINAMIDRFLAIHVPAPATV
jgi:pimeloyl-ACP methyl ester carboxylesterase